MPLFGYRSDKPRNEEYDIKKKQQFVVNYNVSLKLNVLLGLLFGKTLKEKVVSSEARK